MLKIIKALCACWQSTNTINSKKPKLNFWNSEKMPLQRVNQKHKVSK